MAALEVLALNTTVPQVQAPQTGDTYTFPRDIEIPLGTANSVLYLNASKTVTSGSALQIDASGNLGLGVTPSSWTVRAVQVAGHASLSSVNGADIAYNAFYDGAWKYVFNTRALLYSQVANSGEHRWFTAPSGTAGDAISFTQAMTLDASGNLGVGTTSPSARLDIASSGTTVVRSYASAGNQAYVSVAGNAGVPGTSAFDLIQDGLSNAFLYNRSAAYLAIGTNNTERARIDASGNVVINTAAISTSATDGFLYVPTCAGVPTGTPTSYAGRSPIVIDSTNNRLYFYSGGAWRNAGP